MSDTDNPLIDALRPIYSRVRTDKTAKKLASGGSVWTLDKLTRTRLAQHLNGGPARGVCPIKEGASTVSLAVLDFDSHKGEVDWVEMSLVVGRVVDALTLAWGASPILFRSSGGMGVHLYLLWEAEQDARSVRHWLAGVLEGVGLRSGAGGVSKNQVEVFPKQDAVGVGESGSQFILPMAGKGGALVLEELSGMLEDMPRDWVVDMPWPVSDAVPVLPPRERVERVERAPGAEDILWHALDAIPNGREPGTDLDYDNWNKVVLAVHRETGGDLDALERVREWSARSSRHTDAKLEKDWAHAKADRDGGVGLGTIKHLARQAGWQDPDHALDIDAFSVLEGWTASGAGPVASAGAEAVPVERRGVPAAQHLCTDQANANRIVKAYGARVMVAAGRWHVWDGRRWFADEADVYRYACRLSDMVRSEAEVVRRKAAERGEVPEVVEVGPRGGKKVVLSESEELAQSLEAWGRQSEMRTTIEAAVGLARKMLTVDAAMLDRDPWVLNCLNGVVDLRTGEVREHKSSDFITKLAPVEFDANAVCEAWERAVQEIAGPAGPGVPPFLQRWFGYCATGLTREQVFVVHWGDGSNGKSTVLDTVARALGDYAGTAAPGLIAGGERDRHPTEIAALMGKRMVTAHETREGVQLREDFVKQATGGDRLVGRFMREDFFEFDPTHKLQLLTNSKPVVKGQDHGIWRRVRLVKYGARFGSVEDVKAGRATGVRDLGLAAALGTGEALRGVLAWVVRGAVAWAREGLQAPREVLEAGEAYRAEQDRVRQWALECCDLGGEAGLPLTVWEPLTAGMGGLFPCYTSWCKESGYHPLGRQRFLEELERAFPRLRTAKGTVSGESGGRRSILRVQGIRLLPE